MNNFKSGSGNLDFGGDESEEESDEDEEVSARVAAESSMQEANRTPRTTPDSSSIDPETKSADSQQDSQRSSDGEDTQQREYPYFIRRNNVGDEREKRLEIHVRQKVADQEAEFRNRLAAELETGEVSKTDAREFALLAAFEHPEQVAELMRREGFGALD
jgi:hypothetical protein